MRRYPQSLQHPNLDRHSHNLSSHSILTKSSSPQVLRTDTGGSDVFIDYPRVSTVDHRIDLQRGVLTWSGCERVFEDTGSERITERLGLLQALEQLQSSGTFFVWKLDRLAGASSKSSIA